MQLIKLIAFNNGISNEIRWFLPTMGSSLRLLQHVKLHWFYLFLEFKRIHKREVIFREQDFMDLAPKEDSDIEDMLDYFQGIGEIMRFIVNQQNLIVLDIDFVYEAVVRLIRFRRKEKSVATDKLENDYKQRGVLSRCLLNAHLTNEDTLLKRLICCARNLEFCK